MNVIIVCEESQEVMKAFRKKGHDAYSCDLKDSSGGFPEYHIKSDGIEALKSRKWDLAILHPPCTYTALSGNRWYYNSPLRAEGVFLCKSMWNVARMHAKKVALEQPKTIMQRWIGPKSQVIHPWQYGHGETKETWIWLHNLPLLKPTNIVDGRENKIWKMPPTKNPEERRRLRSKTYSGIAKAMAEQWG